MTTSRRKKTIDDMSTPNTPTHSAGRTLAPFHSSTRTAVSTNLDPATGKRTQVLTNSRLELAWVAGELRIRCKTTLMNLDPDRAMQRPMRGDRGLL